MQLMLQGMMLTRDAKARPIHFFEAAREEYTAREFNKPYTCVEHENAQLQTIVDQGALFQITPCDISLPIHSGSRIVHRRWDRLAPVPDRPVNATQPLRLHRQHSDKAADARCAVGSGLRSVVEEQPRKRSEVVEAAG